ncbi:MAG: tetratricopeptide repeat protein, partial [Nitrospinota bacterium]
IGWVYYKKGLFYEAIENLERAVLLVPSDAAIYDHLGDAYLKVNNYEKAKESWENSLREEKNAVIEEKLKKIDIILKEKE